MSVVHTFFDRPWSLPRGVLYCLCSTALCYIFLVLSHASLLLQHKRGQLGVQGRILPILASIISHADSNSSILVEGALDVLVSLLKPSSLEQAEQVHAVVGTHIQSLMLHHQDAGTLQSCCQYLK